MSDRTDRDREYRRQRRLDPTFRQNEQERRRINRQMKCLPMWETVKRFSLNKNMHATAQSFGDWLLTVGNGSVSHLTVREFLCENIIGEILTEDVLRTSVLLAPLNDQVHKLNSAVLQKLPGNIIESRSYNKATSCDGDETDDESVMLPFQPEYLAKVNITGLPIHILQLKVRAVVMLIRNLCIADGLCNGTRLIVRKITKNVLFCTVMTGSKAGSSACIPRITLNTGDNKELPFVLHRTQFPVRLAFAMTINKAQGQTFDKVGLYIDQNSPLFGHGQLYVVLSRCRSMSGIKIQIVGANSDIESSSIKNIVYTEPWPESVAERTCEEFEPKVPVEEIVSLGKSMGLVMDERDVNELVKEHSQELTTEDLQAFGGSARNWVRGGGGYIYK
nr:uncharacterized protein LOC122271690 [Parasteatoda tepidariorum]